MSSSGWVNQVFGVIAGAVVGYFLGPVAGYSAYYAVVGGMAAYGITTALANQIGGANRPKFSGSLGRPPAFQKPSTFSTKDAAAQNLVINGASQAAAVPVVFGRQSVNPNITRWDWYTFRKVAIVERVEKDTSEVAYRMAQEAYKQNPSKVDHIIDEQAKKQNSGSGGGGKGGGSNNATPPAPSKVYTDGQMIAAYTQYLLDKDASGKSKLPKEYNEFITGWRYYLTWEVAICMGPVTEFWFVSIHPGNNAVLNRSAAPANPSNNYVVTLSGGEQGGNVMFYGGTRDQVRNPADPYIAPWANYRGVCFAVFLDYYIGLQAAPASYKFDIGRYPQCLNANGDVIAEIYTRAAIPPFDVVNNPAAQDANPAAILWEIMTDKIWGKGLDPNLLDVDSFVSASTYFATNGIGMSFTMDSPVLITEALEQIRAHVKTMLVWSGGKLYCRCLMDRSTAYQPMITLTSDSLNDVVVARPTSESCPNELRATFTNRENSYVETVAIVQDMAGIGSAGVINASQVQLPCITRRDLAETLTRQLLLEAAYPAATMSGKMNRFETRITPGDFVRWITSEWSDGPLTTYWRVVEITDNDQDAGGITIKFAEDPYCTPTEGIPDIFEPAVPAWEGITANTESDLYLGDDFTAPYEDAGLVVQVYEMPITLTGGDRILSFFAQRTDSRTDGLQIFWRDHDEPGDWAKLGNLSPWAITGTVVTSSFGASPQITRNADVVLLLDNPDEIGRLLEYCSRCPTNADGMDSILGSETNFLMIGDELIQVAQAEAGDDPGTVVIKAWIRGQYGTTEASHASGDKWAFIYQMIPYVYTLRYDPVPLGDIDLRIIPFDRRGVEGTPLEMVYNLSGRGELPLQIETWTYYDGVPGTVTVTFRAVFHNRGAEFASDLQASINSLTREIPDGFEFYVQPLDLEDVPLAPDPVKVEVTFTPEDGNDIEGGRCAFDFTAPPSTKKLFFWMSYFGRLSYPIKLQ